MLSTYQATSRELGRRDSAGLSFAGSVSGARSRRHEMRAPPGIGEQPKGICMDVNRVQSQELASWKEKYMAALFEMDKDRLNQRITDAEVAVAQRTRELFQGDGDASSGTQLRERKALEAALYAVRALRSILQSQPASGSSVDDKRSFAA